MAASLANSPRASPSDTIDAIGLTGGAAGATGAPRVGIYEEAEGVRVAQGWEHMRVTRDTRVCVHIYPPVGVGGGVLGTAAATGGVGGVTGSICSLAMMLDNASSSDSFRERKRVLGD